MAQCFLSNNEKSEYWYRRYISFIIIITIIIIIIIIIIINIINFEVEQVSYIGVSVYWYEICRSELNADCRCVLHCGLWVRYRLEKNLEFFLW